MDLREIEQLGGAADRHWYYLAKSRAMLQMLGAGEFESVLDVGAGSGIFSRRLIDAGATRKALCVDPEYPGDSEEEYGAGRILFRRSAEGARAPLVLMMDVLEHVDDDLALVRQYMDRADSGARLLVTVPAFRSLWSGHDEFLGHRRRYRRAEVGRLLERAGLRVRDSRYFFGLLLPGVALMRAADRFRTGALGGAPRSALRQASPAVSAALAALHDVERWLLFPVNRVAGLTVFALAEKP